MKKEVYDKAAKQALALYEKAAIVLTDAEKAGLEIADFGLEDLEHFGLQLVTYINTERCCAKEMVLFPGQTCPEHTHVPFGDYPGKEETFRCRYGEVFLYVSGAPTPDPKASVPAHKRDYFTVWHEIRLLPGEQYTLYPNTPHWFQAGKEGAVVSEFSTKSYDEYDVFTDPNVRRIPVIED